MAMQAGHPADSHTGTAMDHSGFRGNHPGTGHRQEEGGAGNPPSSALCLTAARTGAHYSGPGNDPLDTEGSQKRAFPQERSHVSHIRAAVTSRRSSSRLLAYGKGVQKDSLLLELTASRHAQDLLECFRVPHRVVDGIMVMGCPSEPLPALCVAPVPVEACPEVADAAARVPEWIVHSSPIEHASYPLPVVGRVVAHKDRPAVAEVLLEPGRKTLGNLLVCRYAIADDADRRVVRVRRRLEQASMERVTRVVVNSPELSQHAVHWTGAACLTVDEYPWCLLAHPARIISRVCPAVPIGAYVPRSASDEYREGGHRIGAIRAATRSPSRRCARPPGAV